MPDAWRSCPSLRPLLGCEGPRRPGPQAAQLGRAWGQMGCTAAGRPGRPAGAARCHGNEGAAAPPRWAGEQVAGRCAGWGRGRKGPAGAKAGGARPGLLLLLLPAARLPGSLGDSACASPLGSGAPVQTWGLSLLLSLPPSLSFPDFGTEALDQEIFPHASAHILFMTLG